MNEYIKAGSELEYGMAAALFKEYAASLHIDLAFQHFEEELSVLQEMYAAPGGTIILCKHDEDYIACVAIRKINTEVAELKRMFVQPQFQKQGIGKILLEKAIAFARECGYKAIRLDSLNYMTAAITLYKKYGFYEIEAYYQNPNSTAVYLEKML